MNELGLSGTAVGNLVAVFSFVQLIVSPISGRFVDLYGRKSMITIGLIIFSISEILFGLGKSAAILFLSRILGGVSAAFIMPAVTAYIADITTNEMRPKALGYMSAAISTGFIIGPGIGGFLADIHIRLPFFFAGAIAFLAATSSLLFLKEQERGEPVGVIPNHRMSSFRQIVSEKYFIAFLILFISSFALAAFESLFSLFVDRKFGFSPKDIAIIVTGGALLGAIFQIALFDRFTKWWGEIRLIRYCLIFSAILVYSMTIVYTYASILFVTIILFIGFDLIRPALTTYLSRIAGNEQGFVAGMNSMFTSIGYVLGPIVGGALFDVELNYPFYFAVIMLVIAIVLAYRWKEASEQVSQEPH